jgi:hypothetical protein
MAIIFTLPLATSGTTKIFNANTQHAVALFLISGPNNKGGQEFVPGFSQLQQINVYLQNEVADNSITLTVYKGSAAENGISIYTQEMTLKETGAKWFSLVLDKPLSLQSDGLYSFTLNTKGRAVWFGTTAADGDYKGLNYDAVALGGWTRTCITAFELVAKYEGAEPYLEIEKQIDALPDTITLQDEAAIVAVREAYNVLPLSQQQKVSNYQLLLSAEMTIADLKEAQENAIYQVAEDAIAACFPVTKKVRNAILEAQQQVNTFIYKEGSQVLKRIDNYDDLAVAIATYNGLEQEISGDPTKDGTINVYDALQTLQYALGKLEFNDYQKRVSDVNVDDKINAIDALMVLQRSIKMIDSFPLDAIEVEKIEENLQLYSKKNEALFCKTYQSMIDRTHENGYAQTSVTGAYVGMFCRDASIQMRAHVEAGDYDQALKLLKYTVDYHRTYDYDYLLHIMNNGNGPISSKVQVDTTFFFLHAWYLYATKAPDSPQKEAFLKESQDKIFDFADYFLEQGYLDEFGLMINPSLEHSRDGRYWFSYDLLTNVYASQALHELALYFGESHPEKAKGWEEASQTIVNGVHTNLISEIDGKKFYAELIDYQDDNRLVQGFSWVNLAPMGCDWYAADPQLLENTYQLYMKYGSCLYYNEYQMLDVYSTYNGNPLVAGNHVIGKGLAWEMMYCKKMGYTQRLQKLVNFVERNSVDMYRETWGYYGGGSDTANQEHASWMLVANKTCFPQLTID